MKNNILKFTLPKTDNTKRFKLIIRLCLGLSHLHEQKFKHSFQHCLNHICISRYKIQTTTHCSRYASGKKTLVDKIRNINSSILEQNGITITKDPPHDDNWNILILSATFDNFISTERCSGSVFAQYTVYKQLALGWQIAKQLSGSTLFH